MLNKLLTCRAGSAPSCPSACTGARRTTQRCRFTAQVSRLRIVGYGRTSFKEQDQSDHHASDVRSGPAAAAPMIARPGALFQTKCGSLEMLLDWVFGPLFMLCSRGARSKPHRAVIQTAHSAIAPVGARWNMYVGQHFSRHPTCPRLASNRH